MRRVKTEPRAGDTRQRSAFLWLPLTIRGDLLQETRWMEKAAWMEKAESDQESGLYWVAVGFIDEEIEWEIE